MVHAQFAEPLLPRDLTVNSPTARLNPRRKIGNRSDHLDESTGVSSKMRDPLINEDTEVGGLLVGKERRKGKYFH